MCEKRKIKLYNKKKLKLLYSESTRPALWERADRGVGFFSTGFIYILYNNNSNP